MEFRDLTIHEHPLVAMEEEKKKQDDDVSCAELQQFHHMIHLHPLNLKEVKHDDKILCSACVKYCSGQTYVCCRSECNFILHESCFHLPRKIYHPCHPLHSLFLTDVSPVARKRCRVCYRFCSGLAYFCYRCECYVHVECPVMISRINYGGHHHDILFVDGLDPFQTIADDGLTPVAEKPFLLCSACEASCSYSAAMFHCAQCNFHLHLKCGPLPCFIKHEDHKCPLKLTDSPVIIEGEDKNNEEFYCDTCEKQRDPYLPVYYCSDGCAYIAEIKCVITEVVRSLSGEYGEVELRGTIFKYKTGNVVCKDMTKRTELSPDRRDGDLYKTKGIDDQRYEDHCKARFRYVMSHIIGFQKLMSSNTPFTNENVFSYCDEDYDNFMTWIHSVSIQEHEKVENFLGRDISIDDNDITPFLAVLWGNVTGNEIARLADSWDNKVHNMRHDFSHVSLKIHPLIFELTAIFQDLHKKYGDIVPKPAQPSPINTTFSIYSLCETIRGMCATRVADISEEKLLSWWRCLTALESQGFKVKFALDRLKRVADAYYALRTEKAMKENVEQIDKRNEEISQQIKKLETEQIALKEERGKGTSKPASYSKVAECFKEASVLKWMIAGEGLL